MKKVDHLANQLYNAKLIKNKYDKEGFYTRLTYIEQEYPGASVILHKIGILPIAFRDIWTYSVLLDIAQQILGDDIGAHPVWNLRCKVPQNEETTVPWHQDIAYLNNKAYNTHQLTAWIPLLNATKQNGCMQIIKYGHLNGNIATHTGVSGNTWYIDLHETIIKKEIFENENINLNDYIETCEVNEQSILLLNNLIPHRSLQNYSQQIRWSLDLRWQNPFQHCGFDDKTILPLRLKNDPHYIPNWEDWGLQSRHQSYNTEKEEIMDTTISGPWMENWELVHENKHTDAYFKKQTLKNAT